MFCWPCPCKLFGPFVLGSGKYLHYYIINVILCFHVLRLCLQKKSLDSAVCHFFGSYSEPTSFLLRHALRGTSAWNVLCWGIPASTTVSACRDVGIWRIYAWDGLSCILKRLIHHWASTYSTIMAQRFLFLSVLGRVSFPARKHTRAPLCGHPMGSSPSCWATASYRKINMS